MQESRVGRNIPLFASSCRGEYQACILGAERFLSPWDFGASNEPASIVESGFLQPAFSRRSLLRGVVAAGAFGSIISTNVGPAGAQATAVTFLMRGIGAVTPYIMRAFLEASCWLARDVIAPIIVPDIREGAQAIAKACSEILREQLLDVAAAIRRLNKIVRPVKVFGGHADYDEDGQFGIEGSFPSGKYVPNCPFDIGNTGHEGGDFFPYGIRPEERIQAQSYTRYVSGGKDVPAMTGTVRVTKIGAAQARVLKRINDMYVLGDQKPFELSDIAFVRQWERKIDGEPSAQLLGVTLKRGKDEMTRADFERTLFVPAE